MEHTKKPPIWFVSVVSLLWGVLGGAVMSGVIVYYAGINFEDDSGPETVIQYESASFETAYEKASPAVVSVVAKKDLSEYYNQFQFFGFDTPQVPDGELQEVSSGTAFILSADGLAVTNRHVVADESAEYIVILSDGTELSAEILDKDTLNDIALLQLSGEGVGSLPTLEFADSDEISVGDPVLAIGNALGEYYTTTTAGIISATDRQIVASGTGIGSDNLVNLIQTDAAINPGNSGGPLVNINGEVVGMNTAIDTTAEGIGFAIPSNDIASVVDSYQEFGRIVRPFVGVRYIPVNAFIQSRFGLSVDYGALILENQQAGMPAVVSGSPADKAGLKARDIILSVNGENLSETFNLQNALAAYSVGDTVTMEILRGEDQFTVQVTLAENQVE